MKRQTFSDKELEYIYWYLDFDADKVIYHKIEKKIRKQIKQYRDHDEAISKRIRGIGEKAKT